MKIPTSLNKTEATKVKLVFSAEFEIISVLRKVLGEEKLMVSSNMWFSSLTIFYTGQNYSGLCVLLFLCFLCASLLYIYHLAVDLTRYIDVLRFDLGEKLGVLRKKFQGSQTYGLEAGRPELFVN